MKIWTYTSNTNIGTHVPFNFHQCKTEQFQVSKLYLFVLSIVVNVYTLHALCMRWTKYTHIQTDIKTNYLVLLLQLVVRKSGWHAMKSKHFDAENRRLSIGTYLLKHMNIKRRKRKRERVCVWVHCHRFDSVNSIKCSARCTQNYMLCACL